MKNRRAKLSLEQLAAGKQWLQRAKHRLRSDPKYKFRGIGNAKYRGILSNPPNPYQRANWDAIGTCMELLDEIRRDAASPKTKLSLAT